MFLNCPICKKQFECTPSRFKKVKTNPCCSIECFTAFKKQNEDKNCICDYCGEKFHKKKSHIKKHNYCSVECLSKHREIIYQGKNNPNAFCRIEENSKRKHCGYYWIFLPTHPLAGKDGYIREHRIIAEKFLLTEENSIIIDGKKYLSQDFEVHHKDLNKLNNDINNLLVVTKSEHQKIHGQIKREALELYKKKHNLK